MKVTNMVDIVSMLFCQHANNINEHILNSLYKLNWVINYVFYERSSNVALSALKQR